MFGNLEEKDLEGAVEALLFVSADPVSTLTMADALEVEPAQVEAACVEIAARLSEDRAGVRLKEVAGAWQLRTAPEYHELLESYVLSWDTRKLSQAALEVLAIVAYTQPVTRQAVANVRGVNSDSSINSLLEKGLLREAGTSDAPGNPALYGTSKKFLEKFGLRSLRDLPDLDDFAPDDATRAFISERLSATRGAVAPAAAEEPVAFEDGGAPAASAGASEDVQPSLDALMGQAMADALAEQAGVVDKIDFDDLEFEE
ncbi:MAG: SMC-Scp complex subunit ScpB [Eggerthellaceae bacterium]|nr:SMC-Scp complex subunit ScpB [Eggerthellaceae bacterium]